MFALRAVHSGWMSALARGGRGRSPIDGFVLPRWLRRPTRLAAHLCSGEVEARPFAATIASTIFLGSCIVYGAYVGGHMPEVVKAVASRTGFAVDQIRIVGNQETSEIDIFERVGLDGWTSLVGFDAAEARDRVLSLPWVEQASVRKVYPAALEIDLVEKKPFAIWQHGSHLTLIEKDGAAIAPLVGARHVDLPLVVGRGAAEDAAAFIEGLQEFPQLAASVKGYIRVSQRRWNLRLKNGITVKLPERGERAALEELVRLDREKGLLSRDIVAVDMRLTDRLVVRLSPDAASAREAALKERLGRDYRPAERRI